MRLVTEEDKISLKDIDLMARERFGEFVKAVVDLEKEVMVVDAEMHADEEAFLIEKNSKQSDLWGVNLYPQMRKEDWVEFDSMINVRPNQGNLSRYVESLQTRNKILEIVNKLVKR